MMVKYDFAHPRSPISITLSVWNALFLREAVTRLSAGRIAWLWLLVDPIIQIGLMLFIFTAIRMRVVSGITTEAWLIIGMVFYLMFKRSATQVQGGLSANKTLFAYRQVKPIDTLLARAWLEGFITVLIAFIFGLGGSFFGVKLVPDDPLTVVVVLLGLWLMGLGFGLVTSVAVQLIPKFSTVLDIFKTILYMTSGVILPISNIPQPYQGWLLYNPLLHGIEAARAGISDYYHPVSGVDVGYLFRCAIVAIFFGLALQRRFETKMITS
jgi:capsular polysaccharide transport system permease protein